MYITHAEFIYNLLAAELSNLSKIFKTCKQWIWSLVIIVYVTGSKFEFQWSWKGHHRKETSELWLYQSDMKLSEQCTVSQQWWPDQFLDDTPTLQKSQSTALCHNLPYKTYVTSHLEYCIMSCSWWLLSRLMIITKWIDRTKAEWRPIEDGLPLGCTANWWHFGWLARVLIKCKYANIKTGLSKDHQILHAYWGELVTQTCQTWHH